MTSPQPRGVRAAAGLAIAAGSVFLLLATFDGLNFGSYAVGALFVIGGLLLRIEAAILQIAPTRPTGVPDRPSRLNPLGSGAEPPTDPAPPTDSTVDS